LTILLLWAPKWMAHNVIQCFKASIDDSIHMSNLPPCTFWQMTLHEWMNLTAKQNLEKKWATYFYEDNIQFNVTHHSAFIGAMKSTSKNKMFYKPFLYHALQRKLLKISENNLSKFVIKNINNLIHTYGATICFNWWVGQR
jgi:hypothetical protein